MSIQSIRKALNVPKDQRIAQYIYNQCREYERGMTVTGLLQGGIDIFYVEDSEFEKLLTKKKKKYD